MSALVGGMVVGADSIEDMTLLRHGAMSKVFTSCYAPSTLGSFLRMFTFGHVRQLDALASRVLTRLGQATPVVSGIDQRAIVDLDDTIVQVHGPTKQGAGFGYSGVRGLNAPLATVTTDQAAPVVVAQRLRRGAVGSPRGATRIVADALKSVDRLRSQQATGKVLVRADSAFYGHPTIGAAIRAGADVSVTVRLTPAIKKAIATITEDAWTPIVYPGSMRDPDTGELISRAEVAEVPFTAFASQATGRRVAGRLVVRRIPDLNPRRNNGQEALFETWRHHAFFTTTDPGELDTVAADKAHRHHALIEQVHADLKDSALAHLPSATFTANAAWLVLAVLAVNLTRAAATLTRRPSLSKATTGTIRRRLLEVPARVASSARKLRLHLPAHWPWQNAWAALFTAVFGPPASAMS